MHCVTILYPNKSGGRFDFDYYLNKHIPMSIKLHGNNFEIRKGVASPDGSPPAFICVARLRIESIEEFIARTTQCGAEIIADMANYTDIEPIIQFDEFIWPLPPRSVAGEG